MCTLSVITRDDGYLLGMNRDERVARGAGLPPDEHDVGGAKAIYPSDGDGGTWIGADQHAFALALLNWNDVLPDAASPTKTCSRGLLIPTLLGSRTLSEVQKSLAALNLEGILPFRLIGVSPFENQIGEWHWDMVRVKFILHRWQARHWFSSSLSDEQAEFSRGAICRHAWKQSDAGSAAWLRRLHAAHGDAPGAFSLCVHRSDVRTLSYTEIECASPVLRMRHVIGSLCAIQLTTVREVELTCNKSCQPADAI